MEPTELECCVLGIVWERGPVTAHAIRTELLASRSSFWSGSAGAIYPLVARLEKRGLLRTEARPWGDRVKRELTLTPAGLAALRAWLAPLPGWAGAVTFDPIRTRLFFLGALPAESWSAFLDDAEAKVRAEKAALQAELAKLSGRFERLAAGGALRELEARLGWLGEVRRELAGPEFC